MKINITEALRMITAREGKGYGATYPLARMKRLLAAPTPKPRTVQANGGR